MPSLAQQLRADRRRRALRRRLAVGLLVGVATVLAGARIVADVDDRRAEEGAVAPIAIRTPPLRSSSTPGHVDRTDGLDPGLADAFGRAQAAAARAGHRLRLTSGYRTPEEQQELLEEEVAARGSRAEALWWVFPPDRSMHVRGLAVDVGDREAAAWLLDHGARFGLCRTLSWEWWHFEWRARWEQARSCPREARNPDEAPDVDADGTGPTGRGPDRAERSRNLATTSATSSRHSCRRCPAAASEVELDDRPPASPRPVK